ncbi:MAG: PKD domain-containing protein, partial [Bacteroidia bacterium]
MALIYTSTKKCFRLILFLVVYKVFFVPSLYAQCGNIDFTSNFNNSCLPALIKFTATGAPSGSTYYWDFGNGNVSGGQVMFETFNNPGNYDVKLEVKFPNGTVCTRTKASYLVFTSVSEPKFGAVNTIICSKPSVVTLIDSTENVTRREWYINGSLINDTSRIINDTFSSPGYKSVTLKVYDNNGCSKALSKNDYLYVREEYELNFCARLIEDKSRNSITATFKPFVDPKATDIEAYYWEFPGGSPSTYNGLTPPTVTYTNYNTPQDVSFSIKLKNGCIVKYTKEEQIRKYYSNNVFTYCETQSVPFYLLKHKNFTVANITSNKKFTYSADSNDLYKLSFAEAGKIDLTITFRHANLACSDSLILKEILTIGPARAEFIIDNPTQCSVPATVNLTALNTNPVSGTNTYTWEIKDSLEQHVPGSPFTPKASPSLNYTFYKEGVYYVDLIVHNSEGCSAKSQTTIITIVTPVPNVRFPRTEICSGTKVRALNNSSPAAGIASFTHTWILTHRDSANIILKGAGKTPTFSFTVPGLYDLEYTISSKTDSNCKVIKNYTNAITVNGIIADFSIGNRAGCLPFNTSLQSIIKLNKPDTSSNSLSYSWKTIPSEGVSFSNSTAANPQVFFSKNGCYTIVLTVKNAYGCSTTVTKDNLVCIGTIADFTLQDGACAGLAVDVVNTSNLNPDIFKWVVEPPGDVLISPSNSSQNPNFIFLKEGCYKIKLVTGKRNLIGCYDSMIKSICVTAPVANFSTVDTTLNCAPVIVQFKNTSLHTDSFYWDFGDGTTLLTADSSPIHSYAINNPNGFTVKMVAISKYGCADSITRKNYIKIYGPVPEFQADKNTGCRNVNINFTNTSSFVKEFYMVYGDNSDMDTNIIRPHQYIFFDYSLESNIFYPTLYSTDTSGCISAFKDTIIVYRPPVLDFAASTTTACIYDAVQIVNTTKYADKYEWDFDDNGTIDDTNKNPVYVYNQTGWKKIRLTAITSNGCVETLLKDSLFYVYQKPTSKFTSSHKRACALDTISFSYSGTSDAPIVRYSWDFDDGTLSGDTSNQANPWYHYKTPGIHRVKLMVFNKNGCTDTFSALIETSDAIPPVSPEIFYVSVTPDNNIEIVYNKADSSDFRKYRINQYGAVTPTEVFSSTQLYDTIGKSTLANVFARSYCFTAMVEDECGLVSLPSKPHCSIHLDVSANTGVSNKLKWNKYQGWDNISGYEIFRRVDKGAFTSFASVGPNDTTYIDSQLCDRMYIYYVRAIHPNAQFFSLSNRDSLRPAYVHQLDPLEMYQTTVINNTFTYTSWRPSEQLNVHMYVVDKFTHGVGLQPSYKITTNNYII